MKNKLISFILALCLLIAIPLEARYKYNPFTRKLDYYETGADIDLGDLADVTLTGLATGNVLYYDGSAWVNLATGANTQFLTLAAGIPAWQAIAAGVTTFVGLNDTPANYVGKAGQLVRVNAGANALEFFAGSPLGTVIIADGAGGWTKTENFRVSAAGNVTLGTWQGTAVTNTYVAGLDQNCLVLSTPTFADITVSTPVNIYALSHNSFADYAANRHVVLPGTIANVLSDHTLLVHTGLGLFDASADVDHNATTNYAANQHVVLPNTIANVLSDHNLAAHTALGLFDASSDVDHDLTTNYVANQHINWTAAADNFSTSEDFFLAWTEAADHASITQTAVAGIAGVPLINIDDDRTGVTADAVGEATIVLNAAGQYALYIAAGDFRVEGVFGYDHVTDFNLWIGYQAGLNLAPGGRNNTLIGTSAGENVTTGDFNVMVGRKAGFAGTTCFENVFIGPNAGENVSSASYSTIVGPWAAQALTSGIGNVAVGREALQLNQTGAYNTVVGYQAGKGTANQSYSYNVFVGSQAGLSSKAGSLYNVYIGEGAGNDNLTGTGNVFIGRHAGFGEMGSNKLFIENTSSVTPLIHGDFSADNITINGDFNITMDAAADQVPIVQSAVAGTENQPLINIDDNRTGATVDEAIEATIYMDVEGLYALYIADGEFAVQTVLSYDYTTNHNFMYGYLAGGSLTSGTYNTLIGEEAGAALTTDENATFIGYRAGFSINNYTLGNTAVGYVALQGSNPDEDTKMNTAMGQEALRDIGAASEMNVAVGMRSLFILGASALENTAVGYSSGGNIGAGSGNVNVGAYSGHGTTATVEENTTVGYRTAYALTTGSYNAILGAYAAEDLTSGLRNVVIGYMAGEGWLDTEDDKLVIDNSDTATPLIYGDFAVGDLISASLTHNSDHRVTGYNRYGTIYWVECFDHGIAANRYGQDWDIASLNTQGAGTNTIDTTPSHITLTTDNNAIGDNEGTISHFQIVLRSRQNRSVYSVDLGQTVNTQFYCGWNTSQTNAMVAAADEYVIVFFDHADNANWQIKVGDGATEDVFTSAIAADTNHITHEIWVESDGTVHWAVNGTELDITGSVDNLMTANGHYIIIGQAQSVTGAAVIVAEICHIENEKLKL